MNLSPEERERLMKLCDALPLALADLAALEAKLSEAEARADRYSAAWDEAQFELAQMRVKLAKYEADALAWRRCKALVEYVERQQLDSLEFRQNYNSILVGTIKYLDYSEPKRPSLSDWKDTPEAAVREACERLGLEVE